MNELTITFNSTIRDDFNNGVFDGQECDFKCFITDMSGNIYPVELKMKFGWVEDDFVESVNHICDVCDDLPVNFHVNTIKKDLAILN